MSDRDILIDKFLKASGLEGFERTKIPGDASFRTYEKITTADCDYILMNAPPEKEDVKPFIQIGEILLKIGLSAPKILAQDVENGFLLLEDFGNKKFNVILKDFPNKEEELYRNAVDVLGHLYKVEDKFHNIKDYSRDKMFTESVNFIGWYLPLYKNFNDNKLYEIRTEFVAVLGKTLDKIKLPNDTLTLLDYHVDNLMLLEERSGVKKVGLLDFQDAVVGNAAYDIVSLLEDARRDVSKDIQQKMIDHFLEITEGRFSKEDFMNDYHILGAQRNLKIIGIFSRLKVRDGKDTYLPMIPRVMNYLKQDLEHESLKELKEFLEQRCVL